jgi:MGT family glycosyltransferase
VYATLGTVVDEPELLIAIMQALSFEGVNVIVTIGRGRDPDRLVPRPANAHVCSYIPQSLLLPHCEVVVAHGGYNTIVGCIDAGVPMLLLPVRGDQAEDAAWCAHAGIARVLTPGQQSRASIRQAVCDLLENPAYRRRAATVRQSMLQQPGLERAVQLLESLPSQRVR